MRKNNLLILLTLFLSSCNSVVNTPEPTLEPSEEVTLKPTVEPTVEPTQVKTEEPSIEVSNDPYFEGYEYKGDIIDYDTLQVGVNDSYNIRKSIENEFKDAWIDIYIGNMDLAIPDVEDNINGLVIGECEVNVVFDETYFDTFILNVVSKEYMDMNFKFDYARLHKKTFTVFGASNSDITVIPSSYTQRQKLWCEQLVERFDMTMYNYAKSGATAGYCEGLVGKNPGRISIVGTYVVNRQEIIEGIKNSDYVFFNFGGNDTSYSCKIGEVGEVNEENYLTMESFKGSYSYMIDKVRSINPNIKVVCMGMTPSTWAAPTYSRPYMDGIIQDLAQEKNCKYVYFLDAWGENEFDTYAPDGTHPLTKGHTLLVEKLLNQ